VRLQGGGTRAIHRSENILATKCFCENAGFGYQGITGARLYHTLWYRVLPMATKSGGLYVGRVACENALHAVRYVAEVGRAMNTHVTVSFGPLGIEDDVAGRAFSDLQARVTRWWRDQRQRKGRDIGDLHGFHCHSNPAGSRHVHWVLHVPAEIEDEFPSVVKNRLQKIARRVDLRDGLHIGAVQTPGSLAKYVLRGIEPEYADYLHIEAANEGFVAGCRRTGVSRAASKAARKRAGWVRKKRRRYAA